MQVSEEDAKKALNEQYGGEDAATPGTGLNHFKFTKYSNAYMLVYVRKSDWDQVTAHHLLSCQCPSCSLGFNTCVRQDVVLLHQGSCCQELQLLRPSCHAVLMMRISMILGVLVDCVPCGRDTIPQLVVASNVEDAAAAVRGFLCLIHNEFSFLSMLLTAP